MSDERVQWPGWTTAEVMEGIARWQRYVKASAMQFRLDWGLSDPNPFPRLRLFSWPRLWGRNQ